VFKELYSGDAFEGCSANSGQKKCHAPNALNGLVWVLGPHFCKTLLESVTN